MRETVFVIKHQLTTCFLLLCLQFQKLGSLQKRFDAHFCSLWETLRLFVKKKEGRQRKWAPHYYSGRGSQSGAGKRVTGYPLSRKPYHSRRGVTNKMALKVVETNKVCESRIARNRPPRNTLPPVTSGSRCQNTAMERETGLTAGFYWVLVRDVNFSFLIYAFWLRYLPVCFPRFDSLTCIKKASLYMA